VAVLARGDHPVLFLMAVCAGQKIVFGRIGAEELFRHLMARAAVFRGSIGSKRDVPRGVGPMAVFAVGLNIPQVRLVAQGALRDLAVDVMAESAVKNAVFALAVRELLDLQPVAVETGLAVIQCYFQRGVGIRVAIEAA